MKINQTTIWGNAKRLLTEPFSDLLLLRLSTDSFTCHSCHTTATAEKGQCQSILLAIAVIHILFQSRSSPT
jgi:hypothetical protein